MSHVNNIILTYGSYRIQPRFIDTINRWLRLNGHGEFNRCDDQAGGKKAFECNVYMVALNYMDAESLIPFIRLFFEDRHRRRITFFTRSNPNIQIFQKKQNDDSFREVKIFED